MTYTPHGKHLIAGERVGTGQGFASSTPVGPAQRFSEGDSALVGRACAAAEAAFPAYAATTRAARADFLDAIAGEIERRGAEITELACHETGLPTARLEGERARTTGQLRLFARHIREGRSPEVRRDPALPERTPAPRPEIVMVERPIGPVALFGASNFPLAFSTAGGDTAAALAAGCPVVVKGHPAHPGTCEIVAEAVTAAAAASDMPAGVFSQIQGRGHEVGSALVRHPLIRAVGFTGSLAAGRALFDQCAARPDPIPFFGELGSVNPVFTLPHAARARGAEIGRGWAASLGLGAGQFCTNPGVCVVIDGAEADSMVTAARAALAGQDAQMMLSDTIAAAYRARQARLAARCGVTAVLEQPADGRLARPCLYETTGAAFLHDKVLGQEVFGPLGIVVRVPSPAAMLDVARALEGQLTATLQMDDEDLDGARTLMPILERKAGRVLVNGFPTGVEVCDAMVHGGPYPASTNFGASSVGTLAIRRFLRPVAFQNVPAALLPGDLPG